MQQYDQQPQGMPMMMSPDSRADVMDKIQPDRVVEQIRMRLLGKIELRRIQDLLKVKKPSEELSFPKEHKFSLPTKGLNNYTQVLK
jgi:hypothetical protein